MGRAKKKSALDYAFADGKIRALEKFLIKSEVFKEAAESDLGAALQLFVEADLYGEELLKVKDSRQLETCLKNESSRLKNLVRELILDEALLGLLDLDSVKCLEETARAYPSEFIKDYIMHLIDMHNIKTYLRLYFLNGQKEELAGLLACEGFIKREIFLELYDKELAAFLNRLEYVHTDNRVIDYAYFLKEAIEKALQERSFIALERAINDFLAGVLKRAKLITFGPEPVIAYYFAKANEINLIRMIILSKFTNAPEGLVEERLNNVYA